MDPTTTHTQRRGPLLASLGATASLAVAMLAGTLLTMGVLSFSGWPGSPFASRPGPLPIVGTPTGGSAPTPAPAAAAALPPAAAAPAALVLPGIAPGRGGDGGDRPGRGSSAPPAPGVPVPAVAAAPVVEGARVPGGVGVGDPPLVRRLTAAAADTVDGASDAAGAAVARVDRGSGETARRTGRQAAETVRRTGEAVATTTRQLAPALPLPLPLQLP